MSDCACAAAVSQSVSQQQQPLASLEEEGQEKCLSQWGDISPPGEGKLTAGSCCRRNRSHEPLARRSATLTTQHRRGSGSGSGGGGGSGSVLKSLRSSVPSPPTSSNKTHRGKLNAVRLRHQHTTGGFSEPGPAAGRRFNVSAFIEQLRQGGCLLLQDSGGSLMIPPPSDEPPQLHETLPASHSTKGQVSGNRPGSVSPRHVLPQTELWSQQSNGGGQRLSLTLELLVGQRSGPALHELDLGALQTEA
ncbi:hypothetical protein INR49_007298 [Caranx melampygus]|nr:hypothetical protein INR49_007298 [Caranx melampygus]